MIVFDRRSFPIHPMSTRTASPAPSQRKCAAVLAPDTPADPQDERTYQYNLRPHKLIKLRMHSRPFTRRDFVQACRNIEQSGAFPGLRCIPESITEGGIKLVNPANSRAYKTVRLISHNQHWPYIRQTDDWASEWLTSDDVVMPHLSGTLEMCCKSNYYAAPWSKDELAVITTALIDTGVFLPARKTKCAPVAAPAASLTPTPPTMPKKHQLETPTVSKSKKPALDVPASKPATSSSSASALDSPVTANPTPPPPASCDSKSFLSPMPVVSAPTPAAVLGATHIPSATEMHLKLIDERERHRRNVIAAARRIVAAEAEKFEKRIAVPIMWDAANTINIFSMLDVNYDIFSYHEITDALLDVLRQRYTGRGYEIYFAPPNFKMRIPARGL